VITFWRNNVSLVSTQGPARIDGAELRLTDADMVGRLQRGTFGQRERQTVDLVEVPVERTAVRQPGR